MGPRKPTTRGQLHSKVHYASQRGSGCSCGLGVPSRPIRSSRSFCDILFDSSKSFDYFKLCVSLNSFNPFDASNSLRSFKATNSFNPFHFAQVVQFAQYVQFSRFVQLVEFVLSFILRQFCYFRSRLPWLHSCKSFNSATSVLRARHAMILFGGRYYSKFAN